MLPHQIRGQLIYKGYSLSSLAREISVTRQAVHQVISGKDTSRRIMLRIAEIIGKPAAKVFPEAAHLFEPQHIAHKKAS